MSRENHEQTIVVTGVTRGIGRAMAVKFASFGHTVIGCGRSREGVEELAGELGKPHRLSTVDVADAHAVDAWAAEALAGFGAPDYVVNNAALINTPASVWEVTSAEFEKLLRVNVLGLHNVTRAFLPAMLKAGKGVIVNMSSGAGRTGLSQVVPYCTTKWAVEGYSASLAQELPETLACVALSPGIVNTDMLQRYFGESAHSYGDAEAWAQRGVPHILSLGPQQNGEQLRTPQ